MRSLLPLGYISLREAGVLIDSALSSGKPDNPAIIKLRKSLGIAIGDRDASDRAIRMLWKAVDRDQLRAMAIGGCPRQIIRLDADVSELVPLLRDPRVGNLGYLRPAHPLHRTFVGWFGQDLLDVVVAFRESEVKQTAQRLKRRRREYEKSQKNGGLQRGRPPKIAPQISQIIQSLIDEEKWSTMGSLKLLTNLVRRHLGRAHPVSDNSVVRALDGLYQKTQDRKYQRYIRKRAPRP